MSRLTNSDYLKSLILFMCLWSPSLIVLTTGQVQGISDAIAIVCSSLVALILPLIVFGSARLFFIVWTPLVPLVLPYAYLTAFYNSVPSDALISAAIHQDVARSMEVVSLFGWKIWLIPICTGAYVLIARSLNRGWKLSRQGRKKMVAGVLMFTMISMLGPEVFASKLNMPPFIDRYTASLTFPSSLFVSVSHALFQEDHLNGQASVHGRNIGAPQPEIVVLVIGESVRADHLGINHYFRNTTPMLAGYGSNLISYSDVASTANFTANAVPNLVSLSSKNGRVALVQTFKEAGFKTAWLSNQDADWFSQMADTAEYADSGYRDHLRKDMSLLPSFYSFVQQSGNRQFIVLHMNGSHANYDERYSPESRVFVPTLSDISVDGAPDASNKAEIINSYDNTIVEMDRFLARVIAVLEHVSIPAIMMFTSDHGENLFDDERGLYLHAQSLPTRYDTHVPLLVWMNASYKAEFPALVNALQINSTKKISHVDVFPSLLELGRVSWDGSATHHGFASLKFVEVSRSTQGGDGKEHEYDKLK